MIWLNWGFQPTDFWQLSPKHFWWIYEQRVERDKHVPKYAGGMTERDVAELYERAYGGDK